MGAPPHDPLLDTAVRRVVAGADPEHPFGRPGRPVSLRSPFRVGFTASIGAGLAYELLRTVVTLRQVLVLAAVALVLAVGLEPVVAWLTRRMRRGFAVLVVFSLLLALFGGFVAAAVPPLTAQAQALVHQAPSYLARLVAHNSTLADLDHRYHLVAALRRRAAAGPALGLSAFGGIAGVGRALLSAATATVTVVVLLAYLMANFPDLKRGAYRLIPRSRRARVGLIADGILARVGGWVLANLATSLLAGVTTAIVLALTGVPYPVALALFVAIADLVPLVGFAIGAVVATAVGFFTSLWVGITCAVFFTAYEVVENRLIVGRLLRFPARVSPLVTIVAAVAGGTLLGVVGAGLAIPLAAGAQLVVTEVLLPRQDRH